MRLLLTQFLSWVVCALFLTSCLPDGCQKDMRNLSQFDLTMELIPQNLRPQKPVASQAMKPDPWPGCTRIYVLQLKGAERYIFVDKKAQKDGQGTSWEDAAKSIGSALKIAFDLRNNGESKKIVLIVAGGEYSLAYETSVTGSRAENPIIASVPNHFTNIDILGGYRAHDLCLEVDENKRISGLKDREVVLDGNDRTTVAKLNGATNVSIKNITIKNGNANGEQGGGIFIEDSQNIVLEHLVFQSSKAEDGGGMSVAGTSDNVVLKNSTFENCQAKSGGGVFVDILGIIRFEKVQFNNNTASVSGGGLRIRNGASSIGLKELLFKDNSSIHGGGAHLSGQRIVFSDVKNFGSKFIGNTASGAGGGLFVEDVDDMDISYALFSDNRAEIGGSIYVHGLRETFNLLRTKIIRGIAERNAGGIFIDGSAGDGTKQLNIQNSSILQCVVTDAADGINGGSAGVYLTNMKSLRLGWVSFRDNKVLNAEANDYWGAALKFAKRYGALPVKNASYNPSLELNWTTNYPFLPKEEFPLTITADINLMDNTVQVKNGANINNSNGISIPEAIHPENKLANPLNYFFLQRDTVGNVPHVAAISPLYKPNSTNINWHP